MQIIQKELVSVVLSIDELRTISKALEDPELGTMDRMTPMEIKLKGEIDQLLEDLGQEMG